jgi:hypothetical protein
VRPFSPRPTRFAGVLAHAGWRIKRYAITAGAAPLDWAAFEPGVALALAALPSPAAAPGRPAVGFLVAHRGRGADYVVLGWWDRENELPTRVFLCEQDAPGAAWRAARGGESFCVWDLAVIAGERDAYVATVLAADDAGSAAAVERYLARHAGDGTDAGR